MSQSQTKVLMWVENHFPQDTRVANEARLLLTQVTRSQSLRFGERVSQRARPGTVLKFTVCRHWSSLKRLRLRTIAERTCSLLLKSFGYVVEYLYFTTACLTVSTYIFVRRGFDVMHAHNPPDTLFLVALPFKLVGKKFVFDQHDLCPEPTDPVMAPLKDFTRGC